MDGSMTTAKTGWLALILALALLASAAPSATADETSNNQALSLLDQGELAAAGGNFEKARQLWQAALQKRPDWPVAQRRLAELPARSKGYAAQVAAIARDQQASLDFVTGVNLFNQGDYAGAIKVFQGVLAALPSHPFAGQYLEAAQAQDQAAAHGSLTVDANQPAEIYVDGQLKGLTPLNLPELPVGEHVIAARAQGVEVKRTVVIHGRTASATSFSFREVEGQ